MNKNAIVYIIAANINTKLKPPIIESITTATLPVTEKNPFTAQHKDTNIFSSCFIWSIPIGKGIPIKKPSGKIIIIDITNLKNNGSSNAA